MKQNLGIIKNIGSSGFQKSLIYPAKRALWDRAFQLNFLLASCSAHMIISFNPQLAIKRSFTPRFAFILLLHQRNIFSFKFLFPFLEKARQSIVTFRFLFYFRKKFFFCEFNVFIFFVKFNLLFFCLSSEPWLSIASIISTIMSVLFIFNFMFLFRKL